LNFDTCANQSEIREGLVMELFCCGR
jgi:hypothetical protein